MNRLPSADNPLWAPIPGYQEPPAELLTMLADTWVELDAALATEGGDCRKCGSCCDFRHRPHILFATALELATALAYARRIQIVDAAAARLALESNLCPFWLQGRCAIHASRPLGCRTFFCGTDAKKVAPSQIAHPELQYRAKLKGRIGFCWYGPALSYWHVNVIAFPSTV
jgi:Fe-S-cluster containining protein